MIKLIQVDRFGIWFFYKGDEVGYIWPWFSDRREIFNRRFYSIGFEAYFKSLKELDECWDGYFKTLEKGD